MSCPICGKPTDKKYRPFCSKRCADIDLGKWLSEGYAIPGSDTDDEEAVSREDNTPQNPIH
ncbi:MAG: DNA gyrase inhibitor YacG [Pseudomonadota bacterium]